MYRCVETGESKTKPEWMQELKCNEDRFKYLIKRRVYVKELEKFTFFSSTDIYICP